MKLAYSTRFFIGVLLCLSVGVGCGTDTPSSVAIAPSESPPVAVTGRPADPCAIVLVPPAGERRMDDDIIRRQQAVRRDTQSVAHLERLGWTFVARARRDFDPGYYTLAEQVALCMTAQHPESPEALLLRGHVLHSMHRFREGEIVARQLVATRGMSFDYGLLGDVLMEQGKLAEAIAAYQHMMDQKPSPQAYSRAAHVRWLSGDLEGALALLQMAAPGFRDAESAAWVQVRLALYVLQAGDTQQAAHHVAVALQRQPEYAPALFVRGQILLAQHNSAAAVVPLTRAVQLNPLPEYHWTLSEALRAAGRPEEADSMAAQLRQRGAREDRRTFALYLAATGQEVDTAVRLAEEELAVRQDVFTLDTLAWALCAAERCQEAWAFSQRALAAGTQEGRLFYHAGVIAAAVGQYDEATRWLRQAVTLQHMLLPSERQHLALLSTALPAPPGAAQGQPQARAERR